MDELTLFDLLLPRTKRALDRILQEHKRRKRQQVAHVARGITELQLSRRVLDHRYPDVPRDPFCTVSGDGNGAPDTAGIYFVWNRWLIVYVGKSTSLRRRARLSHPHIKPGDRLAWVEVDPEMLDFAECYYIGVCRPVRNFGKAAKFRRSA